MQRNMLRAPQQSGGEGEAGSPGEEAGAYREMWAKVPFCRCDPGKSLPKKTLFSGP